MPIHLCFYEVGVRLEQTRLVIPDLCLTSEGLSSVLNALIRLDTALISLIYEYNGSHRLKHAKDLLDARIASFTRPMDTIDGLYYACSQDLDTIELLLREDQKSASKNAGNMIPWLNLGIQIPRGEVTNHRWEFKNKEDIDALIEEVDSELSLFFPTIDNDDSAWEFIDGLPAWCSGWANIEAGLTALRADQKVELPWDELAEARNKWIYEQCCRQTAYSEIKRNLHTIVSEQPVGARWDGIESVPGICNAAKRYAAFHRLPLPASRQPGRRKTQE